MNDYLLNLSNNPTAKNMIKSLGLPIPMPAVLDRGTGAYDAAPLAGKKALVGGTADGRLAKTVLSALNGAGANLYAMGYDDNSAALAAAGDDVNVDLKVVAPHAIPADLKPNAMVFDATGCDTASDMKALWAFFNPWMRKIAANGKIVVLARLPEKEKNIAASSCARGVEGFVKSMAKELGKKGITANCVYVEKGAESRVEPVLRYLTSNRSTFVDGQPVRLTKAVKQPAKVPLTNTLKGKVALVTGAARGIGASTARRMAAEGCHVVLLDIPQDEETLNKTTAEVGGTALPMDVTDKNAPGKIAAFLKEKFEGVDIVVHNAGVTRDKMLANMKEHLWDMVLNINLEAIHRIDEQLIADDLIRRDGRIVCLSSIGGIAGNAGQTNYGATKAGVIGYVEAQGAALAKKAICVNAVAPGFIETRMTAAMPFGIREAGRRLSSLSQGGLPEDVAELICFLSTPGASGVTGNVVRCCGQNYIGA